MPRESWRVYFYQNLENLEAEHAVKIQEDRQNNIENIALENQSKNTQTIIYMLIYINKILIY